MSDAPPPTEPALPRAVRGEAPTLLAAPAETEPQPGAQHDRGAPVPRRVGNLELLEPLGAGGMGEVWKARDAELDRLVAVKLLERDSQGAYGERFRREARAAAAVVHPNVAQIHFSGAHLGRLYYVMELVTGRSLAQLLAAEGRLSGSHCVAWLRQACEGLRAAQQAGVIHRDVKPSNLMVEESGRLKLVDFGLARRLEVDATITRDGSVMGTPSYMSPEQARGAELDMRSDIYSLGATFYHLLTGEPPFVAASAVEVMHQQLAAPLVPLRERNPAVPRALAAVIERMLAKVPADRFQDYDQVLAALDGGVVAEPPAAAVSTARRQGRRWRGDGRRWGTLTLAAVTACLVVAAALRWRAANPPLPSSTARPAAAAVSGVATLAAGGAPGATAPPAAGLEGGATDLSSAAIAPAADARAVTETTLRTLSDALRDDARALRPPPTDVAELIARNQLDPALARDGWGSPLWLDRPPGRRPVLVSAGPDRRPRTGDDLAWLAGVVRTLPSRPRAVGPEP